MKSALQTLSDAEHRQQAVDAEVLAAKLVVLKLRGPDLTCDEDVKGFFINDDIHIGVKRSRTQGGF